MNSAPQSFRRQSGEKDETAQNQDTKRWRPRDYLAAVLLFLVTVAFVLWQNARVAVLWDLGYLLDTSWRIALGQMPYRDFPLVHSPLTFLVQAALIRVAGRHYAVPVVYAAVTGGIGTVLTWRILVHILRRETPLGSAGWVVAVSLAAPLTVLGIYSVYPHPIYDCDCALAILAAIFMLSLVSGRDFNRAERATNPPTALAPERSSLLRSSNPTEALAAGAATVVPVFFKQNMGLPFLAAVAVGCGILLAVELARRRSLGAAIRSQPALVLAGMSMALVLAVGLIAATAGLGNYLHWTVTFAAQRRLPGLGSMLAVYRQPSFAWTLPTLGAGLVLCHTRFMARVWGRILAFCLLAAPFAGSLIFLLVQDDADERADNLLALWPLLLLAALALALYELRRGITFARLLPLFVLAAIHGTFLSQQLWGSTYALWPLLMLLVAGVLRGLPATGRPVATAAGVFISATFLVCGSLYAASLERLNYIQIPDAPIEHAFTPALAGMADRGPFLPNLDELIRFTQAEIPRNDALVLLPGEDPFYYATGRTPQFPVTLFDPTTDPFSAQELRAEALRRDVQWVIVKRVLEINANPVPESEQTLTWVQRDFVLYRRLQGYDVYRRR